MGRFTLITFFLFAGGMLFSQVNQEALETLAGQIAQKRSEAETLSSQLDIKKEEYNERMRSIATQKADIETRIKRQELHLNQLERELQEYSNRIADSRVRLNELKPVILEVIGILREYVSSSLPFQTESRLNELDSLERLLSQDRLSESDILARLWNILEEENRLCRESGLYRQTIIIDGNEQLAEVARLGMVFLYFKTFDGEFGYAKSIDKGWKYTKAQSREEQKQIETLFTSFRKNLREGYFELPNPLRAK